MINDRKIIISVGNHRHSANWQPQTMLISELYERLRVPARSTETLQVYLSLPKGKQDDLKDIGGYVGGQLTGGRRKAGAVSGRDLVTLDCENIPPGSTKSILLRVEGLGCGYCIHSTRKHHPGAPRLRILLPLDRTATADEYEPVARKMAEFIGIGFADPTTFEVSRLMYWPSCCADSEYIYVTQDKPLLSVDGLLALYDDWRDVSSWPRHPSENKGVKKLATKQGDPISKSGVVGAFCRTYDVIRAMDEFLPGVYEAVDTDQGRYTYTGGSTTGGALVYDEGRFLYSHHATDPCSGRLVNAFDLVRLHRFEELDDGAPAGAFGNQLPSYKEMMKLALRDKSVSALMAQEDFTDGAAEEADNSDWTKDLTRGANGEYQKSIKNIRLMIENLPGLTGLIRRDVFSGKIVIGDNPPWARWAERKLWGDADTTALREFLEQWFKPSKHDIRDTLGMIADREAFHPVRDYLNGLKWDGVPRLDTVFIDYMSAPDTPYVRAVTRKSLTACVTRVMEPGVKYDYMVVFVGKQGRGKSMLIDKLAVTQDWFSDSMTTFSGKEAMESVQGKWLIEIPEMHAFDKTEMSIVKGFLTKRSDYFRAAYAEFAEERARQCVLFGTTNNRECLRDSTGNRRFWPVDVGPRETAAKSVYDELEHERDQIWAEAVVRWRQGEKLYLAPEFEEEAAIVQEEHRESHPWEDTIIEFINREVPADWQSWSLDQRMLYWSGGVAGPVTTVPRQRVCCREIWQEAISKEIASLTISNARAINGVLEAQKGWSKVGSKQCGKPYGYQKAYEKQEENNLQPTL